MRRKKFILLVMAILFVLPYILQPTAAKADVTPSASPAASQAATQQLNQEIDQLKEKIASSVAKLNLVEKRGILGTVSDASNNQITLTDIAGNTRYVDVDELTKFYSPSNSTFGFSDLNKGIKVRVLGLYNKESERILARFVDVSVDPTFLSGEVADIDRPNGMLTLATENKKQVKIDIEDDTKISVYSSSDGSLDQYGFSKMAVSDRVTLVGFPEKQDPTIIAATRIIDFPDLPKDPLITLKSQESATPSSAISPTGQ